MKSYEIWLKGGGSLNGTISEDDANRLLDEMKLTGNLITFQDGDGDTVVIRPLDVAVFSFGDKKANKEIGY